jgi:hypothetical protein
MHQPAASTNAMLKMEKRSRPSQSLRRTGPSVWDRRGPIPRGVRQLRFCTIQLSSALNGEEAIEDLARSDGRMHF